ncbi:MAG TPA: putative phage abortive infection protein [Chthoniobacterales bacterium]|nr:putative phage abortive infection protein [Chthoniobacterales bacterium]
MHAEPIFDAKPPSNSSGSPGEEKLGGLYVAIIVVIAVWVTFWIAMVKAPWFQPPAGEFYASRGQFGDMFGAINALFSALAFAALFFATWLQKRELYYQRLQLEGQKQELQQTREVFEKQTFENTFFHLITLHHEILNASTATTTNDAGLPKELRGRDAFEFFYRRLLALREHNTKQHPFPVDVELAYDILHQFHSSSLRHYFRHLYHVVKFVDESGVSQKQFYVDLLRAQLSTNEQLLLFYNCAVGRGRARFLSLALKYRLFDEMLEENLLVPNRDGKLPDTVLTGARWPVERPVTIN